MISFALLGVAALGGSWILTGAVRRYTLARSLMDVPNHRSSHTVPTPRGGGIAIAATTLIGVLALCAAGIVPVQLGWAMGGGGLAIAVVGWLDDLHEISASVRAIIHVAAAAWAVLWLGGLPSLDLGWTSVSLGLVGTGLAIVGIAWLINLYNFMDGIDGLAGTEAATIGVTGFTVLLWLGHGGLAMLGLLIAAASAGFLLWNWAPAKIFMGDVGSGFLGFAFGVLALASERAGALPLLAWMILLGAFVFDATITLIRRIVRGESWHEAHRTHAYQRLVQAGWSHSAVVLGFIVLNIGLGCLALLGLLRHHGMLVGVASGLVLLSWLYWRVEGIFPMRSASPPLPPSTTIAHSER